VAHPISRRIAIGLVTAFIMLGAGGALPEAHAAKKRHPAVKYMERVASELIAAQRAGTISSFSNVIRKRADVEAIANYSIGRYRANLRKSQRNAYYTGVRRFMARYFADQTKKYRIKRAEIGSNVTKSSEEFIVTTKVYLTTGSTYNVNWHLAPRRGSFRITDVKVLGFSMTYLQRNLFYNFLAKRNGNVKALVAALNR
jgi:phospholipid transport system substrate-binding protein